MNATVMKMVGVGVASFVGGILVGAIGCKLIAIPKIEEREMQRYDEEIAKTRARLLAKKSENQKSLDISNKKPPETKETKDIHVENTLENTLEKTEYRDIYTKIHGKYSPPEKKVEITSKSIENNRYTKPVLVDDYESLSAMLSGTGKNDEIFEWIFYYNYKGGIMIDFQTDQFVNYNKIMGYSKRELLDIFDDYRKRGALPQDNTLYFYMPGDGIGAAIQIDGDLKPELMEVDIPAWAYPSPSYDEDEDDDYEDDPEFDPDI